MIFFNFIIIMLCFKIGKNDEILYSLFFNFKGNINDIFNYCNLINRNKTKVIINENLLQNYIFKSLLN